MDEVDKTVKAYEEIKEDFLEHNSKFDMTPEIKEFCEFLSDKNVLDIGCGPGRDSKVFVELGYNTRGIDFTPSFVKMAQENVPSGKFLHMDMRHLEFADEEFDGIWCSASFIHIPKREALATLKGFYRVLKNKGALFIGVQKGDGEGWMDKFGKERFYAFYQEEELQKLLESVGFVVKATHNKKGNYDWINMIAVKAPTS